MKNILFAIISLFLSPLLHATGLPTLKALKDNQKKFAKVGAPLACKAGEFIQVKFQKRTNKYQKSTEKFELGIDEDESNKIEIKLKNISIRDFDYAIESDPSLFDTKDLNGDGVLELLVYTGGCGSAGDCTYQVLTYCGSNKYASIGPADSYFNDPEFSSATTTVGNERWMKIRDSRRFYFSSSCPEDIGPFDAVKRYWEYDGKSYKVSKSENKRLDKLVKKLEENCGKK